MTRKQGKAPAGRWQPADPRLTEALGQFVMSWSLIEAVLEIAISRQLGLGPLESSIVTSGLQFRGRASILLSLLNRNPENYTTAIATVKKIQNIDDRNDLLHSVIGGGGNVIWFNRRKTGAKFSSKIEEYNYDRLLAAALSCSDLATTLMSNLNITADDYRLFFQAAHNAANNV